MHVTFIWIITEKNRISVTRVQNSSRYTEILLYSPRFRSNCRHFSRFDFHACRASISKVNRRHTPRSFPFPIFFYSPAGGIEDICMYSAWLHTGAGAGAAAFQYSRNIVTPRIVAPLPYFPHANAYIRDHRARRFLVILRDIARFIQ